MSQSVKDKIVELRTKHNLPLKAIAERYSISVATASRICAGKSA